MTVRDSVFAPGIPDFTFEDLHSPSVSRPRFLFRREPGQNARAADLLMRAAGPRGDGAESHPDFTALAPTFRRSWRAFPVDEA